MIRGLYTAAAGMISQQFTVEVLSNNIANASTFGFKKDRVAKEVFPVLLLQRVDYQVTPVGIVGTGAIASEVGWDLSQGLLRETGEPLDLALDGPGYFVLETPAGLRYTRQGSFRLTATGDLVSESGYSVYGVDGPIRLGSNIALSDLVVGSDGTIWLGGVVRGKLSIVDFPNPAGLQKADSSTFLETAESGQAVAVNAKVLQGYLEYSNVNPVQEMVDLIAAMRAYEASQRLIQAQDQTMERLINEVGRV